MITASALTQFLKERPAVDLARKLIFPELAFLTLHGKSAWKDFVMAQIGRLWNRTFSIPVLNDTFCLRPSKTEKNRDTYALHLLCGKDKPLSEARLSRVLAVAALDLTLRSPFCVLREKYGASLRIKFCGLYNLQKRLLVTECIVQSEKEGVSRLVTSYGEWDGYKHRTAFSTLCDSIEKAACVLDVNPIVSPDSHKGCSRLSSVADRSSNCTVLPVIGKPRIPVLPSRVKDPLPFMRMLASGKTQGLSEKAIAVTCGEIFRAYGEELFRRYPLSPLSCSKALIQTLVSRQGGFACLPWSVRGKKISMQALLSADKKHMQSVYDNVPVKFRTREFLEQLLAQRPEYFLCLKQHERSKKICLYVQKQKNCSNRVLQSVPERFRLARAETVSPQPC